MNSPSSSTLRGHQLLFFLAVVVVAVATAFCNAQSTTATTNMSTTTQQATTSTTTVLSNDTTTTAIPVEQPGFSISEKYATPLLWSAGPVSILAMLFGGSPVNGLYSTSALAVVEFSICFRDLANQELRFPESAWPGFTVGRAEGQHIRGALVANITMQVSLVVILFAIGAVIATLQSAVKKRRRRVQTLRQQNQLRSSGSLGSPLMMNKNGKFGQRSGLPGGEDEDDGETSLFDRVSVAVWYPGSYILVSSIFLEGIVASIIRLFIIGPDAVDVVLSVLGCIVVSQIMVVAWTVVSKSFHGAGPVRFCSAYVRVEKKYHESAITQFLRSKTASTFLLGNYLWCAKKGTEDSRQNVLPEKARPAGLLVLPFRARNPEESGVIALATRYFFVESCYAFVFAICRGVFEPCEINIWIIFGVALLSTLTLVRVRPFNIPFYNTTAVWSNGAITASAVCIGLYHSQVGGDDVKLAGEIIAMMAALGGALPFTLYLIRVILFWLVNAELCPVGLQDEDRRDTNANNNNISNLESSLNAGGDGDGGSRPDFLGKGTASGASSPRNGKGGDDASPAKSSSPKHQTKEDLLGSPSNANSPSGKNKSTLEDDLELEAILSSEKQPVNWPLRRANDLKLPPLPRADYVDDGNLFVRKNTKKDERPSIFSPEGMQERERLRQRRPKLPDLDSDDVILPIPQPSQNMMMSSNNNSGSVTPRGGGGGGGASSSVILNQSQSPSPSASFNNSASLNKINNNHNNSSQQQRANNQHHHHHQSGSPQSPLMEQYVM